MMEQIKACVKKIAGSKTDGQGEEEKTRFGSNACCECKEGGVFGENVYCSIDGRFHPKRDDFSCKSFVRRETANCDRTRD